MSRLLYISAVVFFALQAFAQNSDEDIKIGEIVVEGNKVILTDTHGNEIKNNIVHNEEDMIDVLDYEKYLNLMSYKKYRAYSVDMAEEEQQYKRPPFAHLGPVGGRKRQYRQGLWLSAGRKVHLP